MEVSVNPTPYMFYSFIGLALQMFLGNCYITISTMACTFVTEQLIYAYYLRISSLLGPTRW